ncbi:MAG: DUF2780 domain-containing protein [Kiritimatiellae bacterium]|nr:DUF2780 domain-containing protein [Kiritimatiellia bacterium]MCO5068027.1 DUF2780 domain-containing protein [Kiritimatiellia bacterium]
MNELIGQLVSQLGVQEGQAKGGAGLLFKLAQSQLGGDFSKIAKALPGVEGLIAGAPKEGGATALLGGLAGALGGSKAAGLATLAGGFSNLKLSPDLIGKFVPVVLSFAKSKGGAEIMELLASVLKK